jgi:hypothetical protein
VTVCAGTPVTLSASGGASAYTWDNGITNAVAFTPTATTTYTVTGTDVNGCVNTDQVTVTVNPLPVVNAGADITVCAGTPVTLSGSGAATYTWDNGITNGVAFTPTATTTYTVTGTNANGCVSVDSVVVTVNPLPVVDAGADITVCAGTPVTLSANGAATYTWNNGITNGVAFTPTATMTYTVTGTNANGCVSVDSVVVTVNPQPVVDAGADITVCAGTPVTLSASGGASAYTWDNGITNGVAFTPTATTTYTVTGTDVNGCVNTDQVTVTVHPLPVVDAGADVTVCAGTPVTLSASGAATYTWDNGITNGVAFTPTATTTYTVTGTNTNGCVSVDSVVVTVVPDIIAPQIIGVISVQSNTMYTYVTNQVPSNTYNWTLVGGAVVSGQGTNSVNVMWGNGGNGSIKVVESNGFCEKLDSVSIQISGLSSNDHPIPKVTVRPNPNKGVFLLEWQNLDANQVMIYNGVGQTVSTLELREGVQQVQVDLSSMAAGVYRAVIQGKEGQVTIPVQVRF